MRLVFRLHRFEVTAIVLAVSAWLAAVLFIGWQLGGLVAQYPSCFRLTAVNATNCGVVQPQFAIWDQSASLAMWLVVPAPMLAGVVLGVPIVARELELRTAQLSWSLAVNRVGWLAGRVWPLLLVAVALLLVMAAASEQLAWTRLAGDDPGLLRYDQRGLIVPMRGIVALLLAVLAGAFLGRTLPAVLVAIALSASVIVGVTLALDVWRRAEAVVIDPSDLTPDSPFINGMTLGPVAILPDGTVTTERNIENLPPGTEFGRYLMIPGSDYWTWVAREAGVLAVVTSGSTGLAAWVVWRRRPI